MCIIGLLGDIHGHYNEIFDSISKNVSVPVDFWIQVGDMGGEDMTYPDFPFPCYFIQGNHENWNIIDEMKKGNLPNNIHFMENGEVYTINNIRVLCMGGNFSPKYSMLNRSDIPLSRRRHYIYEDIDKAFKATNIDIFVTHEAPSPFNKRDKDVGQITLTNVIAQVQPKIHFFGHHHHYYETNYVGVPSYGLSFGTVSCLLYDTENKVVTKVNF